MIKKVGVTEKIATCEIYTDKNWFSPGEVVKFNVVIDNSTINHACHLCVTQMLQITQPCLTPCLEKAQYDGFVSCKLS